MAEKIAAVALCETGTASARIRISLESAAEEIAAVPLVQDADGTRRGSGIAVTEAENRRMLGR